MQQMMRLKTVNHMVLLSELLQTVSERSDWQAMFAVLHIV